MSTEQFMLFIKIPLNDQTKKHCDNDKNSNNQQYENLWITDVSDAELLKTVDSLDLAELLCVQRKETILKLPVQLTLHRLPKNVCI